MYNCIWQICWGDRLMDRRLISISTCFDYGIPIEQQIPLIAKAGFSYVSLGENKEHSRLMSKEGRDCS